MFKLREQKIDEIYALLLKYRIPLTDYCIRKTHGNYFYSDTSAEYLTGMIHYSRWQYGPAAGIGVRMPVGEANSLKIGLQCLWGVTAYVDFWENMASYDNIHTETLWEYNNRKIIPAYLLSLQLEFGTKHHE